MHQRFPDVSPSQSMEQAGARPSVCIVTSELVGPFKNGGIGTSMTGLAQALAEADFPVTVLYTGGRHTPETEREHWTSQYAGIGIELIWLYDSASAPLKGSLARCGFTVPWLIYECLKSRHFDIVQFNDCMGEGLYCLAMRRLGAAFAGTSMFVALHGPSEWVFEIDRTVPRDVLLAAVSFAERFSTRGADLLWSPSKYLLEWSRNKGFQFAATTRVHQYTLPRLPLFGPASAGGDAATSASAVHRVPREIVFFGRLEERKGLRTFCRALDRLNDLLGDRNVEVTFLGKIGSVGKLSALQYIERQSGSWRFEWSVKSNLGQQEALAYLRTRPALAVMASPADNSPCTVYEALDLGLPFLAARTGGIPELIHPDHRDSLLFEPDAGALATRLEAVVRDGLEAPARPAEDPVDTRARWIETFAEWSAVSEMARSPIRKIVAVVDGDVQETSAATLASLIGVDDIYVISRGGAPAAGESDGITHMRCNEPDDLLWRLRESDADAVLLLRKGVTLHDDALDKLSDALATDGCDGVLPAAELVERARRSVLPPLGGSATYCFFEGALPNGVALIKKDRLVNALADRRLIEDAEFFGLADFAVGGGLDLWPYAEPLVTHRSTAKKDALSQWWPERIAAYLGTGDSERFYIASIRPPEDARWLVHLAKALRRNLDGRRLSWLATAIVRSLPSWALVHLRGERV